MSIGTVVPSKRNNTMTDEEVHRKSAAELLASAFNADQIAALLPLIASVDESSIIPNTPNAPSAGSADATYVLKVASDGTLSWEAVVQSASEPVKYTVTFDLNDWPGTDTIAPVEVAAGESVTLPDVDDGISDGAGTTYYFVGWSEKAQITSETDVIATDTYTPAADTTLYLVWDSQFKGES